ncbi:hypothetical protein FDA94_31485 [Herbidospora galbida]|uniref:SEC-C domain-containing protein n=1 Tax=Herbidospora galbida TaxID=2575442 RepID=A0A4U3M6D5_9ACTN|nr:hypothetical protein FDA94_31485 [Herbidospora galbida]
MTRAVRGNLLAARRRGQSGGVTAGQRQGYGALDRNAPCACGAGKKYKRCHGAPTTG